MEPILNQIQHHFLDAFGESDCEHLSRISPQGLQNSVVVSSNSDLARKLGIDTNYLDDPGIFSMFSGNSIPEEIEPISVVYSGHQFGVWAGQLGDGRAMTLGEINVDDELWDLQLKGSGVTPYSRFADGRAVLRSSIREYLCSEAMHGLGINSTRALCLIDSMTPVYREGVERAAIICRVARSHIRFGSFEHFHYRGENTAVKELADYVIRRHFPNWALGQDSYLRLFEHAVFETAKTIANWQAVGFAHGVMNTDNMSILGDTIDYGPFGFIDTYDPNFICNRSDSHGRYAFKNQPSIGLWNLNALANSFTSLLESELLINILKQYETVFQDHYYRLMAKKMGLEQFENKDMKFTDDALSMLTTNAVDYTVFFRLLCDYKPETKNLMIRKLFREPKSFDHWSEIYNNRLKKQSLSCTKRKSGMLKTNPKYILRNYIAQEAVDASENKDYGLVNDLLNVFQKPFDEHLKMERYAGLPPSWASSIAVSCSS